MRKKQFLCALLLLFAFAGNASAIAVIKVPLGTNASGDVVFNGTTFSTLDDGIAGTLGNQNTRVLFLGFAGLPDINTEDASFTLSNVLAVGTAITTIGVIAQETIGGTFNLWAPDNTLLISGSLTGGAITGSNNGGSGSFFNTQLGLFTGGSLLSFFAGNTLDFSLALNNILSGNNFGLNVTNNTLDAFQADGSAIISGSAVPEPATLLLLISGIAATRLKKRKTLQLSYDLVK